MMRKLVVAVIAWLMVVLITVWLKPDTTSGFSRTLYAQTVDPQAIVKQYCVTCHNQRLKTAGLELDALDAGNVAPGAEIWEKVVRKIKTGMMPPSGMPRPDRAVLDAFASELEARLDRAAVPGANLATPALHRLNRTEYANAIRDLLALDINVATLLPADDSSEGFDNIADALSVSPSLIQGYVSAAMKISRQAVGDRTLAPSQLTYSVPAQYVQDRHIDGLPLGTRGGLLIRHTFPLDAEYEFSVGGQPGGGVGATIDVTIDGENVDVPNLRSFRLPMKAGPHALGFALVDSQRGAGVDDIYSDFRTNAAFTPPGGVNGVTITGPFNATGVGDTPSRRQIFVCQPERGEGAQERGGGAPATNDVACARKIMTALATRAYRGPVSAAEIDTLMNFYQQGRKGADFDAGIQQALARVLVAPRFIYRAEDEPASVAAGAIYRVSDLDLASRLSFFLWSSIPDDELLNVAMKGRLRDPKEFERQVRRMLADSKSEALITNFAGQWLYLRDLANVQTEAKNFDANLRQAFRRETEMFFSAIVREDRSLLNLIDADFTFVDERLARHYGIPNIRGSYFRRISLEPDSPRRGLLGQGSMLTVTSVATRTSPVTRGKWILENLLGTPPPVPPPGVETNLDQDAKATKPKTLRGRLELHRANPVCASCHKIMDPMGFALENFDLVGTWREFDSGAPIDSSGQLADGSPLQGAADLRRALLSRSGAVMTTITGKLMTYALGRPLDYADMPTIRAVVRRAAANDNRFSSVLLGIVESDPFQERIKRARGPVGPVKTQGD
jgi:cytochrome c551/c552